MSYYYTKLSASLTDSTIWREPHTTRIVWITMLAMSDKRGRVWASIPGLADRARVTLEECETALSSFMAPDPYSRTADHDGRRIEKIDGGWRLLNYEKHRNSTDEEYQRERNAKNVAAYRARMKTDGPPVGGDVSDCKRMSPQTETETKTERTKTTTLAESDKSLSAKATPKVLGTLPLIGGEDHEIRERDVEGWKSLYPAVDIMQELRSMKGWLIANPSNRKTKKGIMRFVNNWLTKAQNSAPRQHGDSNGTYGNTRTSTGNRAQDRTNGNLKAAQAAIASILNPDAGGFSGSEAGSHESRNAETVFFEAF